MRQCDHLPGAVLQPCARCHPTDQLDARRAAPRPRNTIVHAHGSQVVIINATQEYTRIRPAIVSEQALVRPAALGYYGESCEHSQSYPCLTLWGPW